MKVLVIGGMHGNEMLGVRLVSKLQSLPLENVDVILANENAVDAKVRYTTSDLNRSFPGVADKSYESSRARQLLKRAKNYDLVLDFHNTYCPDNDCGFVGETANDDLMDIAVVLGLNKVIVADYDCINKYAANCLSVEISVDSEVNNVELWYKRVQMLAAIKKVTSEYAPQLYKFVYRITLEDAERLKLRGMDLKAFTALPEEVKKGLKLRGDVLPIFVNDRFTLYNFGGVVQKITKK